jgi:hypothetical protein
MNKKRFLIFFALLLTLATVFTVACFGATEENAESAGSETVLSRVWEYVTENASDLLSATSLGSVALYILLQKKSNGSFLNGISRLLTAQKGVVSASDQNRAAVESLSADQKKMLEYYERDKKADEERNKIVATLLVEVMGLVEIQHVLCLNNSNVPQSIKNLVTSTYARCLTIINDDEAIKKAYAEMRSVLGLEEVNADEKKDS